MPYQRIQTYALPTHTIIDGLGVEIWASARVAVDFNRKSTRAAAVPIGGPMVVINCSAMMMTPYTIHHENTTVSPGGKETMLSSWCSLVLPCCENRY